MNRHPSKFAIIKMHTHKWLSKPAVGQLTTHNPRQHSQGQISWWCSFAARPPAFIVYLSLLSPKLPKDTLARRGTTRQAQKHKRARQGKINSAPSFAKYAKAWAGLSILVDPLIYIFSLFNFDASNKKRSKTIELPVINSCSVVWLALAIFKS